MMGYTSGTVPVLNMAMSARPDVIIPDFQLLASFPADTSDQPPIFNPESYNTSIQIYVV